MGKQCEVQWRFVENYGQKKEKVVRSMYQYVLELDERLEDTLGVAREELQKSTRHVSTVHRCPHPTTFANKAVSFTPQL